MSVQTGTKRKEGGFAETVRVVIHALIIALVIRTFLFQPFNIPSGSMMPTLLVGDYCSSRNIPTATPTIRFRSRRRCSTGRILGSASRSAATSWCSGCRKDNSTDYIKRVIGLPGDRIQMIDGVLNINGTAGEARAHRRLSTSDEDGAAQRIKR